MRRTLSFGRWRVHQPSFCLPVRSRLHGISVGGWVRIRDYQEIPYILQVICTILFGLLRPSTRWPCPCASRGASAGYTPHGEVYAPRRHNTHTSRLTRVYMHSERAVCASLISLWPFSGVSFLCGRSVAYSERANAHAAVCSRPSPAPPAIARRLRISSPATLLVLVARVTLVLRDDLLLDVGRHNLI